MRYLAGELEVDDCLKIRQLYASLDRELDVQESLRVQSHVAGCRWCRENLLDEQTFLSLTTIVLEPPRAPERTRSAVREELSQEVERAQRMRRRGPLSPGLLSAAFVLALFFAMPHTAVPKLVTVALTEHRAYLRDPARLQLSTSDEVVVQRWLKQRLPFQLRIPEHASADARLVGANVRTGPNASAILTYNWEGTPLSLLIAPARTVSFSDADAVTFRNVLFHSARVEGRHVLQWSDTRHTYVLVACRDVPLDSLPFVVQ